MMSMHFSGSESPPPIERNELFRDLSNDPAVRAAGNALLSPYLEFLDIPDDPTHIKAKLHGDLQAPYVDRFTPPYPVSLADLERPMPLEDWDSSAKPPIGYYGYHFGDEDRGMDPEVDKGIDPRVNAGSRIAALIKEDTVFQSIRNGFRTAKDFREAGLPTEQPDGIGYLAYVLEPSSSRPRHPDRPTPLDVTTILAFPNRHLQKNVRPGTYSAFWIPWKERPDVLLSVARHRYSREIDLAKSNNGFGSIAIKGFGVLRLPEHIPSRR